MIQLLQDLEKGEILLAEIPLPNCGANEVLTKANLVSMSFCFKCYFPMPKEIK
jgi:hypothetical protein